MLNMCNTIIRYYDCSHVSIEFLCFYTCMSLVTLGSAIRDTWYALQPAQYVNTSIRSTLVCQYALPFRGPYGPDLTQASVSLSQSAHYDQEKWF